MYAKFKAAIINIETGLRDGNYFDESIALHVFDNWKERFPNLTWELTTEPETIVPIPDNKFCSRNLSELEKAEMVAKKRNGV